MEAKKILQSDILDIIFDQRNKDYGAYELRRNYQKRARNAVIGTIIFALVAVSAPLIAGLISGKAPVLVPVASGPRIIKDIQVELPKDPPAIPMPIDPPANTATIPTIVVPATTIIDPPSTTEIIPSSTSGTGDPTAGDPSLGTTNTQGGTEGPPSTIIEPPVEDNKVYLDGIDIDQNPEFPGGEDALLAYLSSHIQYPKEAMDNDVEGKIVLGFIVNKEGKIDEIKVLRGLGFGCDDEAMRVINGMPKWKPGKNNGKAVNVYFNLPIQFEIGR